MPSIAAETEAGNALYEAITDVSTWPTLLVKTCPMHTSPVAHGTISTSDRVETGEGKSVPVGTGINSRMLLVPTGTTSYTVVSVSVFVIGTACSGSTRAESKHATTKGIIMRIDIMLARTSYDMIMQNITDLEQRGAVYLSMLRAKHKLPSVVVGRAQPLHSRQLYPAPRDIKPMRRSFEPAKSFRSYLRSMLAIMVLLSACWK